MQDMIGSRLDYHPLVEACPCCKILPEKIKRSKLPFFILRRKKSFSLNKGEDGAEVIKALYSVRVTTIKPVDLNKCETFKL